MRIALASIGLALAVAGSAGAQRPLALGVGGGVSFPLGDFGDAVESGWHAMGTIAWTHVMHPWSLRLDGAYHRFPYSGAGLDDEYQTATSGTLNLAYRIPFGASAAAAYLIGGLGAYQSGCSLDCEAQTDFGWNAGLGLRFLVFGFGTFLEGRYHSIQADAGDLNYVPVTLGIMIF